MGIDKHVRRSGFLFSGVLNSSGGSIGALCAVVHYTKTINGRRYPKAARTGPYAFAQEVTRVDGRVVTRYLGIVQVSEERTDVIEMEEGSNDNPPGQTEVQQKL
jgi:hypothetical protein